MTCSRTSKRRLQLIALLVLTATLAFMCSSCASTAPPAPQPDPDGAPTHPQLFDRIQEHRLDNGMLFLLLPRNEVPIVSCRIMVKVGNVDNPPGATGLAHMFEHMAFKGTDGIGVLDAEAEVAVLDTIATRGDELAALLRSGATADSPAVVRRQDELAALEERAARYVEPSAWLRPYETYVSDFNAYTSQDITVYQADLTANNLEAWMLMDSERLQHPVFREFYSELGVVKEERRQRTDDNPEAAAGELLKSLAFKVHPYRYPTIGYMADLETLTPRMIRDFSRTYYTPGNMVGVLVGDFDPATARELIDRYFGDIPAGPVPSGPTEIEPAPDGQRRGIHRQGEERVLMMAFPGLGPHDPRQATAQMLAGVLSHDRTCRLDRRLDFETGVVRRIWCRYNGGYLRYPGLFSITARIMPEHTNEEAEALVWQVLDELVTDPVSDAKLDEIRRSYRRRFYFGLQKNADLAELLVEWQARTGDWRDAYRRQAALDQVTAADVTELARDLLRPQRASVVFLEPETASDDGGES